MLQNVLFAKNGLAEPIDQKVDIQRDDWRLREPLSD